MIGGVEGAVQQGVIMPGLIAEVREPRPSVKGLEVVRGVQRSSRRAGQVAK